MAGLLYSYRYFALVFGAGAGLPAWADLAFAIHKTRKQRNIPVMDFDARIGAKLADARS
jgi:hypothetical protein